MVVLQLVWVRLMVLEIKGVPLEKIELPAHRDAKCGHCNRRGGKGVMKFKLVGIGEVLWDLLPCWWQLGGAPANFAYHAGGAWRGGVGGVARCLRFRP